MKLLVVEDEPRISSFLVKGLRAHGYAVEHAASGEEALAFASRGDFDLLLLDRRLPDLDGLDILRRLRRDGSRVPVIVLTARGQTEERIEGLDLGADDYIVKPFAFDELLARVRARLRGREMQDGGVLRAGELELDLRTRRARIEGREVPLAAREFSLLETFMRHPGHVLSREQLLSHAWGITFDVRTNVVDVYVGYLRRKLGGGVIQTVRGMGYRLVG